ncbi:hypothetical protein CGL27_00455 [Streptomyces sp. 11-1-2]|nr:hypothetical protein CGL27_00455 [Streptomyces sp. 11-1-2]
MSHRSSRPHHSPRRTSARVEERVLRRRREHHIGQLQQRRLALALDQAGSRRCAVYGPVRCSIAAGAPARRQAVEAEVVVPVGHLRYRVLSATRAVWRTSGSAQVLRHRPCRRGGCQDMGGRLHGRPRRSGSIVRYRAGHAADRGSTATPPAIGHAATTSTVPVCVRHIGPIRDVYEHLPPTFREPHHRRGHAARS